MGCAQSQPGVKDSRLSDQQVANLVTPTSRPHLGEAKGGPPPYAPIAQNLSSGGKIKRDWLTPKSSDLPPNPVSFNFPPPSLSAELILDMFQQGLGLRGHETINAFNNCKHRRLKIHMDPNPALDKATREAILTFARFLYLIGKGTMCHMEFFWMSRSNLESPEIQEEDRGRAKALNRLMKTDNWNTACNMIKTEPELERLGLKDWLKRQQDRSPGLQGQCTADATRPDLNREPASEKHARLLSEARRLMTPYFAGWELKNIDMEELVNLDAEAVKEAKKQSRVRNNVSFTLEKEIGAYQREINRGGEGTPTTVVLLVGSPIVEAEKNSVINCQKGIGFTSKLSHDTVTGDMFCIQTLAFTEFMPRDSVKRYQQIDNAFGGNKDINDLTEVTESKLLEYGPSAKLFEKVLNSHLRTVDKSNLAIKDMYGKQKLCDDGNSIVFPTVKEVNRIFGRDDEDSEDGNGHFIRVSSAD
ncbi:hypothetical protein FBULB1_9002 [Fusarium bulbicola]|nr:hypothetical protein FBULB1_9002 [Fusarium bulbicola]